ncbi:MAG: nucleotidyl transferase AbiEii/AbiGii toxin family protein [Candidatus Levybacteria bacterium]|nr:nucleotidyl transferase AbiEii/AbiGii toxin family protein [Candidatus Levybacteria bacterium]
MGKTILTPKQLKFLEFIQSEPQIIKRFYLTGGTALAEFYLKHRLSEDIDLFTIEQEVDQILVRAFLEKVSPKLSIIKIKESQFLGLFSYKLIYKDSEELKVDFNYYPFPRIDKGIKYKNLDVDSIYDIAVNKVHTLFMKPRVRDYIDLYFIMQKFDYSLEKLILDSKAKFDWHIDKVNLANQFIRVKDIKEKELPKILIPFDKKDMEKFFIKLAKSLESEIFK